MDDDDAVSFLAVTVKVPVLTQAGGKPNKPKFF